MTQFEYIAATRGYNDCPVIGCENIAIDGLCLLCVDTGCEADSYCECEEQV